RRPCSGHRIPRLERETRPCTAPLPLPVEDVHVPDGEVEGVRPRRVLGEEYPRSVAGACVVVRARSNVSRRSTSEPPAGILIRLMCREARDQREDSSRGRAGAGRVASSTVEENGGGGGNRTRAGLVR